MVIKVPGYTSGIFMKAHTDNVFPQHMTDELFFVFNIT
jgi:hypothetical protein